MPYLVCAAITAISALISLGYSIAAIGPAIGPARALAYYASARSVAFAVLSLAAFVHVSLPWLEAAAAGMIIVQAVDAWIGTTLKDTMKTWGPAGTALANLAALIWVTSAG